MKGGTETSCTTQFYSAVVYLALTQIVCPIQTLLRLIRQGKHVWPGLQPQLKTTQAYFTSMAKETVSELFPSISEQRGPSPWRVLYLHVWPQVMAQTFDELQVLASGARTDREVLNI